MLKNESVLLNSEEPTVESFIKRVNLLLAIIAILVHFLCACALLGKKFQKIAGVNFLIALSSSILLIFACYVINWISENTGLLLKHQKFVCHVHVLIEKSAFFLSVWFSVCICVERVITVTFHDRGRKYCSHLKVKITIFLLATFSLVINLNITTTYELLFSKKAERFYCVQDLDHNISYTLEFLHLIFNTLLPYAIRILFIILLIKTLRKHSNTLDTLQNLDAQLTVSILDLELTKSVCWSTLFHLFFAAPTHSLRIFTFAPKLHFIHRRRYLEDSLNTLFIFSFYSHLFFYFLFMKAFRKSLRRLFVNLITLKTCRCRKKKLVNSIGSLLEEDGIINAEKTTTF